MLSFLSQSKVQQVLFTNLVIGLASCNPPAPDDFSDGSSKTSGGNNNAGQFQLSLSDDEIACFAPAYPNRAIPAPWLNASIVGDTSPVPLVFEIDNTQYSVGSF